MFTSGEQTAILTTYAFAMAYYCFALWLALKNACQYIVGQKRYKEPGGGFLIAFYLFSLGVILPRMAQISC
jgi:hypothetical protein